MGNRAWNWIGNVFTGLFECGFRSSMLLPVVSQDCQSETYRFGHTPVEGKSDGTRGEPQNSPCAAPEVQQINQRNSHSIKGRADIPYIKNRAARAFPIQFPSMLSYL